LKVESGREMKEFYTEGAEDTEGTEKIRVERRSSGHTQEVRR
jgi:hypothetical protein